MKYFPKMHFILLMLLYLLGAARTQVNPDGLVSYNAPAGQQIIVPRGYNEF
ncbi:UNVERIFIED_CONTAM: hypothetical protein FKN15_021051 [Acipenser sinensis]